MNRKTQRNHTRGQQHGILLPAKLLASNASRPVSETLSEISLAFRQKLHSTEMFTCNSRSGFWFFFFSVADVQITPLKKQSPKRNSCLIKAGTLVSLQIRYHAAVASKMLDTVFMLAVIFLLTF